MAKYIKNIGSEEIVLMGAGISVGEYKQIPPNDVILWVTNQRVVDAINNGDVIVASSNDGSGDLATPSEAFDFLAIYECSPNDIVADEAL